MQEEIARIFKEMDSLYIADGHHRAASAVKVGLKEEPNTRITPVKRSSIIFFP